MCRIEEKVYITPDGSKKRFEEFFKCDAARRRDKVCSKPERRKTEYVGSPPLTRDDASSPASNNPPTPSGMGAYIVEERRPSSSGRRPSLKPANIIIEIGSSGRDQKKYPRKYISKTYKTQSGYSTPSNEIAMDSPGSDASYTVRTGFPETVPQGLSLEQSLGYTTRHIVPQGHRHNTSTSSITTSQTPSLYTTSETEPESPLRGNAPEYPLRTIIHNTRPPPSSPRDTTTMPPSAMRTTRLDVPQPQKSSRETSSSRERDNAGDYSDFVDLYASSGHTSSNASSTRAAVTENTDRAMERERRRKRKEEEAKRAEEDRRVNEGLKQAQAAKKAQEEQAKRVTFAEVNRGDERERLREQKKAEAKRQKEELEEQERIENEKQKKAELKRQQKVELEWQRHADLDKENERLRRRESVKHTAKDPEKRATKRPEREKTQPPTRDFNIKREGRHSRRNSLSQADVDERERLIRQEKLQMSLERAAAEQREREEEAAEREQRRYSARPSAQPTGYQIEDSRIPASVPSNRRRASISQGAPILTQAPVALSQKQTYSTRPPSSNASSQQYPARETLPSARYSPSQLTTPFAQPSRTSNSSMEDNPFAAPSTRPIHPTHPPVPIVHQKVAHQYPAGTTADAWDTRALQNSLPSYPLAQLNARLVELQAQGVRAQQGTLNRPQAYGDQASEATRNTGQAYSSQVPDEWR